MAGAKDSAEIVRKAQLWDLLCSLPEGFYLGRDDGLWEIRTRIGGYWGVNECRYDSDPQRLLEYTIEESEG